MSCRAVLVVMLAACGDDGAALVDARADARVDAAPSAATCQAEVVLLGSGLDVQVPLVFDTSEAVASQRMQADCDDLRVQTEPDGGAERPFWLESGCGTAETRLWLRTPQVAPGSLYLTWGDPGRPRASNLEATFEGIVGEEGDLAAAWPMEDDDAARAADATGGGHDGALVGEPTRSLGAFGQALVLDGVDDAMLVSDAAVFDTPGFTFEVRIFPDDLVENAIASRNDFSNTAGWVLWLGHPANPGHVTFEHAGAEGTTTIAGTVTTPGYVALTYDGASVRLYVDGVLDGSAPVASLAESFDDELRVGTTNGTASDGTPFFRGELDDVRFWSRPISAIDIARLHQHRGTYVTPALPGRVLLVERGADVSATVLTPRCRNQ